MLCMYAVASNNVAGFIRPNEMHPSYLNNLKFGLKQVQFVWWTFYGTNNIHVDTPSWSHVAPHRH